MQETFWRYCVFSLYREHMHVWAVWNILAYVAELRETGRSCCVDKKWYECRFQEFNRVHWVKEDEESAGYFWLWKAMDGAKTLFTLQINKILFCQIFRAVVLSTVNLACPDSCISVGRWQEIWHSCTVRTQSRSSALFYQYLLCKLRRSCEKHLYTCFWQMDTDGFQDDWQGSWMWSHMKLRVGDDRCVQTVTHFTKQLCCLCKPRNGGRNQLVLKKTNIIRKCNDDVM